MLPDPHASSSTEPTKEAFLNSLGYWSFPNGTDSYNSTPPKYKLSENGLHYNSLRAIIYFYSSDRIKNENPYSALIESNDCLTSAEWLEFHRKFVRKDTEGIFWDEIIAPCYRIESELKKDFYPSGFSKKGLNNSPEAITANFRQDIQRLYQNQQFLIKKDIIVPELFIPTDTFNNLKQLGTLLGVDIPALCLAPNGSYSNPITNSDTSKDVAAIIDSALPFSGQNVHILRLRELIAPFTTSSHEIHEYSFLFARNIISSHPLSENKHYKTMSDFIAEVEQIFVSILGDSVGCSFEEIRKKYAHMITHAFESDTFSELATLLEQTQNAARFTIEVCNEMTALTNSGTKIPKDLEEKINRTLEDVHLFYLAQTFEIYESIATILCRMQIGIANWHLMHACCPQNKYSFGFKVADLYDLDIHKGLISFNIMKYKEIWKSIGKNLDFGFFANKAFYEESVLSYQRQFIESDLIQKTRYLSEIATSGYLQGFFQASFKEALLSHGQQFVLTNRKNVCDYLNRIIKDCEKRLSPSFPTTLSEKVVVSMLNYLDRGISYIYRKIFTSADSDIKKQANLNTQRQDFIAKYNLSLGIDKQTSIHIPAGTNLRKFFAEVDAITSGLYKVRFRLSGILESSKKLDRRGITKEDIVINARMMPMAYTEIKRSESNFLTDPAEIVAAIAAHIIASEDDSLINHSEPNGSIPIACFSIGECEGSSGLHNYGVYVYYHRDYEYRRNNEFRIESTWYRSNGREDSRGPVEPERYFLPTTT